jgi:hypothetical protein
MSERRLDKILITVMTYPHPSTAHQELVCTAGVNESGEWIRLYPIDYRYQPRDRQFHKYQWIEVETDKPDANKDNRKESRNQIWIRYELFLTVSTLAITGNYVAKLSIGCRI